MGGGCRIFSPAPRRGFRSDIHRRAVPKQFRGLSLAGEESRGHAPLASSLEERLGFDQLG